MIKIPVRHIAETQKEITASERFKIRKVQDILNGNDLKHDLHRHNFFFILALQKGDGIHEIDFTPYNVLNNSVFFLRPGQVHQLELKADNTGYLMEFNNEFYHQTDKQSLERLRKASNKNYCQLEVSRFEKLSRILTLMFDEFSEREEGYMEVIKALLSIFFIEFVRQSPNPGNTVVNANSYLQERFEEFMELLEQNITSQKQVFQYTERMNLSPYQLNEITKTSIGKTASELINELIILEAKRHLLATPNQVKEIADHLGYEDVSYFIRFFKKHTGYSPEAFRHNLR